jgi:hypothetical protein
VNAERYYTVNEAAAEFFQGKVSAREVYLLFSRGELLGFRVGVGKGKILIYASSLEAYRAARENVASRPSPRPPPAAPHRETPAIRLTGRLESALPPSWAASSLKG